MRRPLFAIIAILALCLVGYGAAYVFVSKRMPKSPDEKYSELAWLKEEFQLTDSQFQKVKKLHEDYMPQCETMCSKIQESNLAVANAIKAGNGVTPDLTSALDHQQKVQQECQTSMLKYIYAVSQEMTPDQGRRFVVTMSKHILSTSQGGEMPRFENQGRP